jgi:hypothetical protein
MTLATIASVAVAAACTTTGVAPTSQPTVSAASSVQATPEPSASPSPAPIASASSVASASPAGSPSVSLTEWKVILSGTIKSGKTKLTINDIGVAAHELLVFKSNLAPSAFPTDKSGDIEEDGPGVKLLSDGENIDPGGTQTRTIDLAPGTYFLVCNIPGHFKQGMFTEVTVAP